MKFKLRPKKFFSGLLKKIFSRFKITYFVEKKLFYPFPRVGVSADCPGGVAWTHVTSDVLFQGVSYLL